jgi:hypothetical protein
MIAEKVTVWYLTILSRLLEFVYRKRETKNKEKYKSELNTKRKTTTIIEWKREIEFESKGNTRRQVNFY